MRWLEGITDLMARSLSKLWESEGQGSLACCSPWDRKEVGATERLNSNGSSSESSQGLLKTMQTVLERTLLLQ